MSKVGTCPLGDDCDLTVAWMAGAEDQRKHMHGRIAELAAEVEALRKENERLKEAIEAFWACPSEDNMDLMICVARKGEPSSAALQGETD